MPIICPAIYETAGRQRNTTNGETSLTSPTRQIGVRPIKCISTSISVWLCDRQITLLNLRNSKNREALQMWGYMGSLFGRKSYNIVQICLFSYTKKYEINLNLNCGRLRSWILFRWSFIFLNNSWDADSRKEHAIVNCFVCFHQGDELQGTLRFKWYMFVANVTLSRYNIL